MLYNWNVENDQASNKLATTLQYCFVGYITYLNFGPMSNVTCRIVKWIIYNLITKLSYHILLPVTTKHFISAAYTDITLKYSKY